MFLKPEARLLPGPPVEQPVRQFLTSTSCGGRSGPTWCFHDETVDRISPCSIVDPQNPGSAAGVFALGGRLSVGDRKPDADRHGGGVLTEPSSQPFPRRSRRRRPAVASKSSSRAEPKVC